MSLSMLGRAASGFSFACRRWSFLACVLPVLVLQSASAADQPVSTVGFEHSCRLTGGNAVCEGNNAQGQANGYYGGDAAGLLSKAGQTCAVLKSGERTCWGSKNSNGKRSNSLLPSSDSCGMIQNLQLRETCSDTYQTVVGAIGFNGVQAPSMTIEQVIPNIADILYDIVVVVPPLTVTTPAVPGVVVNTPAVTIPKTCGSNVVCVGPFTIPPQQVVSTPAVDPKTLGTPGQVITPPPGISSPEIVVSLSRGDLNISAPSTKNQQVLGETPISVPTPFGPLPVVLCEGGCDVADYPDISSSESFINLSVRIGSQVVTHNIPIMDVSTTD